MRRLFICLLLLTIGFANANPVDDELKVIQSLFYSDLDSAISYSLVLKETYKRQNNEYGKVKIHYILGFFYEEKSDFGKSVVSYLEGLRYADNAIYEGVHKDQISLRKNLGNIYGDFSAFESASIYYEEAIHLADQYGDNSQLVSLKFNQALMLSQMEKYTESIQLFEDILSLSDPTRKSRILNELGILHQQTGNFKAAIHYFNQLIIQEDDFYKAQALHNLGEIHFYSGHIEKAQEHLRQSIELKIRLENPNPISLFTSYKTLGEYELKLRHHDEAEKHLTAALELIPLIPTHVENFKLYHLLSKVHYRMDEDARGEFYADLYSEKVEENNELQKDIEETDKLHQIELITRRYQESVASQENIARISLSIIWIVTGSLVIITILVYLIVRLRRKITDIRSRVGLAMKNLGVLGKMI